MGRGHVRRERDRLGQPLGLRALPRRAPRHPLTDRLELDRRRLLEELAARWRLTLGEPYPGHVGLAVRAEREGTPVVLKLSLVEPETEHEGDALAFWPEDAAVRVLEHDRALGALLLERCLPGTTLWEVPEDEAMPVATRLLERLWSAGDPGPPFRRLADEAPRWAERLTQRPLEPALLREALAALRELASTQGAQVLSSEDFHGGNVLLSERGWLAIDPKPIVGEREFGVVSLVRDRRPVDAETVRRRLDFLSAELGLDRERMRRWSIVHALWWGFEGDAPLSDHLDAARALSAIG